MKRYPDDGGGHYDNAVDLSVSHPEGGHDPERQPVITRLAPNLSRVTMPRQPIRVGHTTDVRNPSLPIFSNGEVIQPGDAGALFLGLECSDCDSEAVILPHQEPGVTWCVVEHRASCPAFRAWVAGRRP